MHCADEKRVLLDMAGAGMTHIKVLTAVKNKEKLPEHARANKGIPQVGENNGGEGYPAVRWRQHSLVSATAILHTC